MVNSSVICFRVSTNPLITCQFLAKWIQVMLAAGALVPINDYCRFQFCIRIATFFLHCYIF